MIGKADPRYVREARKLIGQRAVLTGGGMPVQYVFVVDVVAVQRGHALVRTYWTSQHKTEAVSLFLQSWRLRDLAPKYRRIPLGQYDLLTGMRVRPRKPSVSLLRR